MKPSDISRVRVPGAPTLSPDGTTAVLAVQQIDLDEDDYRSQLWLVPTDGLTPARQLTHGWKDATPVYSPDGRWLAFVRAARGADGKVDKPQLYVMPTAGGEARRITDHPLGAGGPVWSPDSTRLAYTARVPETRRYGTDEKVTPEKEPPRRITTFAYRLDDLGFINDRRMHVFVVDAHAADAVPAQLTDGDYDHAELDWSPAGDLLAFTSARHEARGDDLRADLCVCAPDGSGLRTLTGAGMRAGQPRFTPDGRTICFIAGPLTNNDRAGVCRNEGLWSVPADGSAPARQLTDQETYNLAAPFGMHVPTADGVLFLNEHRGGVQLLRVPYDGSAPSLLVGGERQVTAVATANGTIAVTLVDPYTWGELAVLGADAAPQTLTGWNAAFGPSRPQAELTATAPDGYPVHGWVVRPEGAGPHPVLLMIHGGPFTQYGWRLFDEAQVYASAGYAVVMGNPRGSSGYGEAHGRAVIGNVGEASAADLLALLDAALAVDPSLDGARVGVLGGSHGGFMTTWLAGRYGDRFRAAISERAVNAIDSFTGSSDIGWFFADDLYGADLDQQAKQSPLTHADAIAIPMLIIHSEHDWRCPIEQAQRLFVTLKRRGVPVELLLFPGEGHELSRSGLPSHRIARFEAILDWWGRHV
ncbi:MAG TPA: S9 family peptidase [Micromonosporaceae bacterium]|nr:S9 family peptidase [Micromonosporaceae bacterium]